MTDGDTTTHHVTRLLKRASAGESDAAEALMPLVYEELRRIAERRMAGERGAHTLQATDLVHEAYLRLGPEISDADWENRAHFYRIAATAMRRILIEHARRRGSVKRGGDRKRLPMNVIDLASDHDEETILALDDSIERLEKSSPALAEVVRMRFFAGLTVEETAKALNRSPRTVAREWTFARAWLFRELE